MGYYSDVAIAVDKKVYNALKLLKPEVLPKPMQGFEPDTFELLEDHARWIFKSVKWYARFEDVDAYTRFLDYLDQDPDGLIASLRPANDEAGESPYRAREPYGFMRIGEDDADFEERGEPCDYGMEYQRAIVFS